MPAIVWKGYVSFGLISFPVRLHSAARANPVHFHMLHKKDQSRIKEVWFCAKEDKRIDRDEIVKGYETAKGDYVVIEEEELKKIAPPTASIMEILQFVKDGDVDPIYLERSYYVSPGENMTKPYALFAKALAASKHSAIAKLSMHNREHVVIIRSAEEGLILHTLYYAGEMHAANKAKPPSAVNASAKELELAEELIKKLTAPFKPEQFHDTYRENVERLIDEKKKGHKITVEEKPKQAKVIDLMEALKQSLARNTAAGKTAAKSSKKRARAKTKARTAAA